MFYFFNVKKEHDMGTDKIKLKNHAQILKRFDAEK